MSNQTDGIKRPVLIDGQRRYFLSTAAPTFIGRQGCAILLNGEGVFNRHAVVTPVRGGFTLQAIDGQVCVNSAMITGAVVLKPGDQIQFGSACLTYEGTSTTEGTASAKLTHEDLYEKNRPCIICVRASNGLGSGFLIKGDGLVVTNRHVVGYEKEVEIQFSDGRSGLGKVIRSFPEIDLAFIRVSGAPPTSLVLAEAINIRVGQAVLVIGHPLGLSHSLTRGIVSALNREIMGNVYLQTDASISPGNSGGPIINEYGEVVGIATFSMQNGQGLNFAIPAETIRQRLNRVLAEESRLLAGQGVYCPVCGALSRGGSFCPNCGVRFEITEEQCVPAQKMCSKCGKQLNQADRFCSDCGTPT